MDNKKYPFSHFFYVNYESEATYSWDEEYSGENHVNFKLEIPTIIFSNDGFENCKDIIREKKMKTDRIGKNRIPITAIFSNLPTQITVDQIQRLFEDYVQSGQFKVKAISVSAGYGDERTRRLIPKSLEYPLFMNLQDAVASAISENESKLLESLQDKKQSKKSIFGFKRNNL